MASGGKNCPVLPIHTRASESSDLIFCVESQNNRGANRSHTRLLIRSIAKYKGPENDSSCEGRSCLQHQGHAVPQSTSETLAHCERQVRKASRSATMVLDNFLERRSILTRLERRDDGRFLQRTQRRAISNLVSWSFAQPSKAGTISTLTAP